MISTSLAQEHVASGLYELLATEMLAMEKSALAMTEYGTDFVRVTERWSGNHSYKDTDGAEWRTNIIGEIASAAAGSVVSAKGNHYAGKLGEFKQLDDSSKVKDILVVKVPTEAPDLFGGIFYNQIGSLNAVRESDEKEEIMRDQKVTMRDWVRNASGDENSVKDHIVIHMLPKYGNPNKGQTNKCLTKRTLSDFSSEEDLSGPTASVVEAPLNTPVVTEGAFYDPRLNVDFGGPYFNLVQNKLLQLDVVDSTNALVAPWNFYDALKPGTLVLICASLHCFVMREGPGVRKMYQINAHRVRILADSDGQPFVRTQPTIPASTADISKKTNQLISHAADTAFANFNPTKRIKLSLPVEIGSQHVLNDNSSSVAGPSTLRMPGTKKGRSSKKTYDNKLKQKIENDKMQED
ncbi:hypothetical protein C0992_012883 [Termitomyces sp. T32_za158]|nr:hypothetical protein C0992_012883 [Termitomyces sp. T32_za158]